MAKMSKQGWLSKDKKKKRKSPWQVDFRDGQGKRRRKFFSYREDALDFFRMAQIREERSKNRLSWVTPVSYETALIKYREEHLELKSKTHCHKTFNRLTFLSDYFDRQALMDISTFDIQKTLKERLKSGKSNKTVNEDRSALRGLFRWAKRRGFAEENPVDEVEGLPKLPRTIRRAYKKEEIESILLHACSCCFPAIAILANTGIRLGELENLCKDDFDLERQVLFITHLESTPVKGKQSRIIFLNDMLMNLVPNLARGKVLKIPRSTFEKHFRKIRIQANVPDAIPHGFRHSYTSHLIESGMDLGKVQRIIGHSDIKTLQKYLHSTGSDLMPYRNSVQFLVPSQCHEASKKRTNWDKMDFDGQSEKYSNLLENNDLQYFQGAWLKRAKMGRRESKKLSNILIYNNF